MLIQLIFVVTKLFIATLYDIKDQWPSVKNQVLLSVTDSSLLER